MYYYWNVALIGFTAIYPYDLFFNSQSDRKKNWIRMTTRISLQNPHSFLHDQSVSCKGVVFQVKCDVVVANPTPCNCSLEGSNGHSANNAVHITMASIFVTIC